MTRCFLVWSERGGTELWWIWLQLSRVVLMFVCFLTCVTFNTNIDTHINTCNTNVDTCNTNIDTCNTKTGAELMCLFQQILRGVCMYTAVMYRRQVPETAWTKSSSVRILTDMYLSSAILRLTWYCRRSTLCIHNKQTKENWQNID